MTRPDRDRLWRTRRANCALVLAANSRSTRSTWCTCRPTCTTVPSTSCQRCARPSPSTAADDPDRPILVGYADCGTGGLLDAYMAERRASSGCRARTATSSSPGPPSFDRAARRRSGHLLPHRLPRQALRRARSGRRSASTATPSCATPTSATTPGSCCSPSRSIPTWSTPAEAAAARLGLAFEHHHVGLDHFGEVVTVHLRPIARTRGRFRPPHTPPPPTIERLPDGT